MSAPSRATAAGRAYLDLRAMARSDRCPVDELLQLYVLESFLARLADSRFADQLVLKGGVLLAAFGERRPTQVAGHRLVELAPLARVLDGYGEIGQARWTAWRRKQQLEDRIPDQFAEVVSTVVTFADPVITDTAAGLAWDPASGSWSAPGGR